jgi:predicted DCC family thiol-disulfide oxidoreductase YuxK
METEFASAKTQVGWVLYDGACGVCARWVPAWRGQLARIGLGIAPLQGRWVAERMRMPPAELSKDLRLLFDDGTHLAGAEVYRYAMKRLWWARPFYALSIAPGLRWVFDRTYRGFADRRLRISAACRLSPPSA